MYNGNVNIDDVAEKGDFVISQYLHLLFTLTEYLIFLNKFINKKNK